MGFQVSDYAGDKEHAINATGDCCVGDHVRFDQATFGGSYRKPTFTGFRRVTGEIVRDSYGAGKQQHTFTLRLEDGNEMRIKGRNLYANGVWRKPWADEDARRVALAEKHARGDRAREARQVRRELQETGAI